MAGVYNIKAWSDIVTATNFRTNIVDGLQATWNDANREEEFYYL